MSWYINHYYQQVFQEKNYITQQYIELILLCIMYASFNELAKFLPLSHLNLFFKHQLMWLLSERSIRCKISQLCTQIIFLERKIINSYNINLIIKVCCYITYFEPQLMHKHPFWFLDVKVFEINKKQLLVQFSYQYWESNGFLNE